MPSRLRERLSGVRLPRRLPSLPEVDFGKLHLPDIHLPELHLPEFRTPQVDWRGEVRRTARTGALWPGLFAVAGAGAAFWWWNQWARGQAEADEHALREREAVAAGAAHPEAIMAHAPPPPDVEAHDDAADSDSALDAIMAHAPAPGAAAPGAATSDRTLPNAGAVVDGSARRALDEALAVQASAERPAGA